MSGKGIILQHYNSHFEEFLFLFFIAYNIYRAQFKTLKPLKHDTVYSEGFEPFLFLFFFGVSSVCYEVMGDVCVKCQKDAMKFLFNSTHFYLWLYGIRYMVKDH